MLRILDSNVLKCSQTRIPLLATECEVCTANYRPITYPFTVRTAQTRLIRCLLNIHKFIAYWHFENLNIYTSVSPILIGYTPVSTTMVILSF